jgi:hypothetical protein
VIARLGRWLLACLILVLLMLVSLVLVNLSDRPLSDSASRWLNQASPAADSDSIAASLWALDAPANLDATAAGRRLRAAYLARSPEQIGRGDWAIDKPYKTESFALPFELGCLDPASACVASALAHSALVRQIAVQQQALLSRLDALEQGKPIEELPPPPQPHAPAEQFAALVAGHSLELALASVDVGDAKLDQGVARLERMTRLSRDLLAGCATLACKLSASGMLRRSLLVYSELLNQTSAKAALDESLGRVAMPLAPAELDLTRALDFELQLAHNLDVSLAHAATSSASNSQEMLAVRATPLFFKQDATFNLQAELADIEAPMVNVSAVTFEHDHKDVFEHFQRRAELMGAVSLASLYNPLGRILASGLPTLEQAAAQLHDVEVLAMAVRAKALLLNQSVRKGVAQTALDQRPAGLFDCYTGQPLQFDANSSSIVLTQHGPRPVGKVLVGLES